MGESHCTDLLLAFASSTLLPNITDGDGFPKASRLDVNGLGGNFGAGRSVVCSVGFPTVCSAVCSAICSAE